jgi:UDP-N-acetylmuramoylalanine--D-glutamate ligase
VSPTHSIADRRALVLGLGVSGEAAARALAAAGTDVLAVDAGDGPAVRDRAARLAAEGITSRTGGVADSDLAGRDLLVPSPGVPESSPLVTAALRAGVDVWSEPELAWRLNRGRTRLVGVTGTNGKTTVTELVAACLDAPAAGNIGRPLVALLSADAVPALAVAELSSFQLRFTHTLAPAVAVLVNVAADHLDWHGTLEAYGDAKARIWSRQTSEDTAVVNVDDAGARRVAARRPPPGRVVGASTAAPDQGQVGVEGGVIVSRTTRPPTRVLPLAEVAMRGRIGVANAVVAAAAALAAGAGVTQVAAALRTVGPGPHRLERVAEIDGIVYVNDSKATNPHAAAAALGSFVRVVWIGGGLNKGLDFDALAGPLAARARAVVTIGAAGPALAGLARRLGIPVVEAGTLAAAVPAAADLAEPGDTVLLAPACASMDQFRDYADRGEAFRSAVGRLRPDAADGAALDAAPGGQGGA